MSNASIQVRFDRVNNLSKPDADKTGYVKAELPCVPSLGEIVNLNGNPYIVCGRGWSVESPPPNPYDTRSTLYAYVRCIPAFSNWKGVK